MTLKATGGRNINGFSVGTLMLESRFPRIPGDTGNANIWNYLSTAPRNWKKTGLLIFEIYTLVQWVHEALVRKTFAGISTLTESINP